MTLQPRRALAQAKYCPVVRLARALDYRCGKREKYGLVHHMKLSCRPVLDLECRRPA